MRAVHTTCSCWHHTVIQRLRMGPCGGHKHANTEKRNVGADSTVRRAAIVLVMGLLLSVMRTCSVLKGCAGSCRGQREGPSTVAAEWPITVGSESVGNLQGWSVCRHLAPDTDCDRVGRVEAGGGALLPKRKWKGAEVMQSKQMPGSVQPRSHPLLPTRCQATKSVWIFMYKAFGAKNNEWLEAESNTELKRRPAQSAADGRESNTP